jgi:hypothetical protein
MYTMETVETKEKEKKPQEYELRYRTLIRVNEKGEHLNTEAAEWQQPGFHYRTLIEGKARPMAGESQESGFRYRTLVSPKKEGQPQDTETKESGPQEPEFKYRTIE